ncbi:MAG: zinc-ribbon domain-containing protein [SAR324 cluster bacterium]|nr:zinc-ribbon domain-containing protein [SAR324 cluster bacterium]
MESTVSIQCPNCQTRYRVNESRVNRASQVKCTKCQFLFTPDDSSKESRTRPGSLTLPTEAEKAYLESVQWESDENVQTKPLNVKQKQKLFITPNVSGKTTDISESQQNPDAEQPVVSPVMKPATQEISAEKLKDSQLDLQAIAAKATNTPAPKNPEIPKIPPLREVAAETRTKSQPTSPVDIPVAATLPVVDENEETVPWGRLAGIMAVILVMFAGISWGIFYLGLLDSTMGGNSPHQFEFVGKLEGHRIKNLPGQQTLFVIQGKMRNLFPSTDEISWIQLKGFALNENRETLETAVVYAGNVLKEEELSTWGLEQIKDYYKYNSGRNNSNYELPEGAEVDFQIVFFNSSGLLESTSVRIVSYVRQNKPVYVKAYKE